jgi:hypothetical protein
MRTRSAVSQPIREGTSSSSISGLSVLAPRTVDALFLWLRREQQRIAQFPAGFRPVLCLALGDVLCIDGNNARTTSMRSHHHTMSLTLVDAELRLQDQDDKLARGVIVIDEDDLVKTRPLSVRQNSDAWFGINVITEAVLPDHHAFAQSLDTREFNEFAVQHSSILERTIRMKPEASGAVGAADFVWKPAIKVKIS